MNKTFIVARYELVSTLSRRSFLLVAFGIPLLAILISAGAPMVYSMTLLFTLGIFSVYPFFIIWKTISRRVAMTLAAVLVVLGISGGVVAAEIHTAEIREMMEFLDQGN